MEKIRLDVITMDAVPNYGSVLQAFATKKILENNGFDVTVIDYCREDVSYDNLVDTWAHGNLAKSIAITPTIKRWKKIFCNFRKKYLNLTPVTYTTEQEFERYKSDAKAYCVGSDQVWNSKWNNGIIKPLYLSFVSSTDYKFSFSSSFGQDWLTENEVNSTVKYINQFRRLSVREDTGLNILRKQYRRSDAVRLLDPTLLLSADEWRKIAPEVKEKKYILIYNLNRSKEFDDYAMKLSKKTGLKLVRFCTRYDQFYRPGKSLLIPDVEKFISYIDNATYVLTDSFHATAFSINLETEPICIMPPEFSNRLNDFLKLVQCENRIVKNYRDFHVIENRVDYNVIRIILNEERQKAQTYIEKVYSDILDSKFK